MKVKNYEQESSIHQVMAYLEQFDWFNKLDLALCKSPIIRLRLWWHDLWVRSAKNHPTYKFDREILGFVKSRLDVWHAGNFTPYDINFILRNRLHCEWHYPLDNEPQPSRIPFPASVNII